MTHFTCGKCCRKFKNGRELIKHYESDRYARNGYNCITYCPTCQSQFKDRFEFDLHIEQSVTCEFFNPIAFKTMKTKH